MVYLRIKEDDKCLESLKLSLLSAQKIFFRPLQMNGTILFFNILMVTMDAMTFKDKVGWKRRENINRAI